MTGAVLGRFVYDSYGSPTTLNPDWSLDADGTDYAWAYLHQGRHNSDRNNSGLLQMQSQMLASQREMRQSQAPLASWPRPLIESQTHLQARCPELEDCQKLKRPLVRVAPMVPKERLTLREDQPMAVAA